MTAVPAKVVLPLASSTMLLLAEEAFLRLTAWSVEMVASYLSLRIRGPQDHRHPAG
jgi:hypothetical protein